MTKKTLYVNNVRMPRSPRINLEGYIYHVINRGNNRQAIFLDDEDFLRYLNLIGRYKSKFGFKLYSYCLMANHVHLLIEPSKPDSLSKIMQSLTTAHTKLYHYKYKTSGHLWQGRFKSPIIQTDGYLLECIKYIELNPARANIVNDPKDYKWSSYNFHAFGERNVLLDEDCVFKSLGDTLEDRNVAYLKFIQQEFLSETMEKIRQSIIKEKHLGDEVFENRIKERLNLLKPKQRGRPKTLSHNYIYSR